jgi:hypothetical protein
VTAVGGWRAARGGALGEASRRRSDIAIRYQSGVRLGLDRA